jgi:hypothetical protein
MKVKELIEQLQKFDPETLVMVDGYEGGYSDILELHKIPIKLNYHKDWYYGKHEECDAITGYMMDCEAVIIPRDE